VNELTDRTPAVIAAEINGIKEHTRNMILQGSIEIGRRLVEAKSMLPHGEWGKWLKESVNYSQRTADNLMQIYKEYGNSNSQLIANLPYTKAVALLGIPAEEREQFAQENDILNITVRKLQQAIDEKKKAEEERAAAEAKAQTLSEEYKKLEQTNRENYEKAERLRRELEEAKASGSPEDIEHLSTQLAQTENDLSMAQQKIKELERQLRETPVEVAVTEKIPDEVQRELEELRKQNNKPIMKFTFCFDALVKGFNDILAALNEITNPDDHNKYKNAVKGLIGKMSERL